MKQNLIESSFQERQLSIYAKNQKLRIFLFQIIGTTILATGVCCTFYKNPIGEKIPNTVMMHDLCISLSLYVAIALFAPFTGGHYNPAVSLGVFINNKGGQKMKISNLLTYILAQFIGASIGCGFSKLAYDIGAGPFSPQTSFSFHDVMVRFAGQTIGLKQYQIRQISQQRQELSFLFLMILIVTTQVTSFITEECWIHLFIPMCLYGGRKLSKYVGGLNPAVVIILQLVTFIGKQNSPFSHFLCVLIIAFAEMLGAGLAALFFNLFYSKILQKWRNQQF